MFFHFSIWFNTNQVLKKLCDKFLYLIRSHIYFTCHTILSKKNWNECFHFITSLEKDSWPNNYEFNWTKSGDWILHGGFQLGYCSGLAINRKLESSVVILSNYYNYILVFAHIKIRIQWP